MLLITTLRLDHSFFLSLSSSSALFSPSPAVLWAQSVMGLECRWALKAPLSLSSSSYSSVSLLYSCWPLPQGLPLRALTKVTQPLAMTRRGRDWCLDSHPLPASQGHVCTNISGRGLKSFQIQTSLCGWLLIKMYKRNKTIWRNF